MICVGCRRDSQSRKKTLPKMYSCSQPQATFTLLDRHTISTFSGLPIRGVFRLSETMKTQRLRRPGPARSGCVLGLGRDVFFGGRSRERSVLKRVCSESTKHLQPLFSREAESTCGTPSKVMYRVVNIELKPARAPRRVGKPRQRSERYVCM